MNKKSSLYTVFFISAVCLFFALGISVVHNVTNDMLKENEALHRNKILCNAFMLNFKDDPRSHKEILEEKLYVEIINDSETPRRFYRLIDSEEKIIGFDFTGMGFWDYISGVVVLSQDLEHIINIQFFEQKETPGLGGRILEEWFTNQFQGVSIAWNNPVFNRIIIKSAGKSNNKNQINSITGATQTSMALNRILNSELEKIRQLVEDKKLNNK